MTSTPHPEKILYTSEEARIALDISARTLWGMTASGEIPRVRFGRAVRYLVDDLRRWIDSQKQGGEAR